MFSLVNFVSWLSEVLSSNLQENEVDNITESVEITGETSPLAENQMIEHALTAGMVDSNYEQEQYWNDPSLGNDLVLDCLRTSDSEDWDAEIDSMSSEAMSCPPSECSQQNFGHDPKTKLSDMNGALSQDLREFHLHDSDSEKTQYFDGECFPKASTQKELNVHSSNETSLSVQNCHYKEHKKTIACNFYATKSNPHSEHKVNLKVNPHHRSYDSSIVRCDEGLPNQPQIAEPQNENSKQQFVKDILTNFQDSIPHDITNDSSFSNSNQTFNYENMFHWDFMEKLTHLEAAFTQEEKPTFLDTLKQTLDCTPPYSFLLYLIENYCSNVLEGKKSLAHVVLTEFDKWQSEGLFNNISPVEMEKDRALWIVTTRKLYLFDLCSKVFKLDSKGNEYLQRHVYYLLQSRKKYKEAVTIARKLNLQPCFQPMEILFPLVILNKVQLAESYIANCPWQQRAFVSMLDKLCVMSDEQLDDLTSEIIPSKPSSNKVTQASLTKLGERIVKKFTLNPEDFPALFKAKNVKGLCYLLHQRQKDKGGSSKKWDDLIERCVGSNSSLQQSLVELLTEFGDQEEAKRWERYYQLSSIQDCYQTSEKAESKQEDWEDEIKVNEEECSRYSSTVQLGNEPDLLEKSLSQQYRPSVKYLSLDISMDDIYFVDDIESLRSCQRAVSKPGVTIGFDAEWKPQMCQAGLAQRLSIVQLSLRDRVFILDVIALAEHVPESLLLAFGNAVFSNENVLKLGYGVESDFKALVTTIPVLEKSIKKMKRFVDLCTLSQQLLEMPAIKKRVESTTQSLTSFGHLSEKGLSLLVQQCLGLPLDKTYQLSDWEQRPLLTKQVEYAALDARCLIDVFDVLKKWMRDENIVVNLDECNPRLPWLFPKRSRRKQGKIVKHPKPGTSSVELERLNEPAMKGCPKSPRGFRVVVDNMLQGLGRYLRCCGVDVIMLANQDDHDKAAKIARRDNRVILTTGTPYYTLRSQVPLGHCMCVPAGGAKEQVLAVFKHFNIQVNASDIFSRCQVCNGNEYIKVGSVLMRQAYINYYDSSHEGRRDNVENNKPSSHQALPSPLDVETLTLCSGVKLKIEALPEAMLDKIELFYCCAACGKIFWEGGHFSRICAQFSDVLNNPGTM
ncbi:exonuclease mut-7 homolog [Dendronephthya gigantea]|uniref:exonuclease mut-7 homolog n=1 Tax=Dendronephthya gigantea TaxID=151771 RepID=UPI00106BFB39|nr:exonuclease mut-7 homolog [Dendronephthya gigantea]